MASKEQCRDCIILEKALCFIIDVYLVADEYEGDEREKRIEAAYERVVKKFTGERMREIYEQVKPASTVDEMRAELFRLEHYDPLVRSVMDMANYKGLKGEDRYAILAYHAVKSLNELKGQHIKLIQTSQHPLFVLNVDNDSGISLIKKNTA